MENSFGRVKSIINRLREVIKCQKCFQLKDEDSMMYYHVCDHFYCRDCLGTDQNCPLCGNLLDKPSEVVNDKNILSLYQSLVNFELPSKDDAEKIYKSVKELKEKKLKNITKEPDSMQGSSKDTPKNHLKGSKRESRKTVTPEGSSLNTIDSLGSTSGRRRQNATPKNTPVRAQTGTEKNKASPATPGSSKRSLSKTNINKRNPKGETQLHLACKKSNFAAMDELIAAGANLNAQDNAGWTPLHDSVFSGNIEVIKFLLEKGAKVNAPGLENTTALHEAIAKGNVKIVKILLEYGADVRAMNIFKETPLDLVTKYHLEEMKGVLLEAENANKVSKKQEEENDVEIQDQELILYKHNLSIEEEKLVNKFVDKFQAETITNLSSKNPPSHIIVSGCKIEVTWTLISSVPHGCWVVSIDWVKDSLKEDTPKAAGEYELSSLPGFSKARANKLNQLPGLFSGCHFFFGGNFEHYSVKKMTFGKDDLKAVVEKNGGVTLKRCPDPESLALEKTIPFHASSSSSLRETSYFIIYQTEKWDPKPKYNMSHMKTLPVEWLMSCILRFELIDPNDKISYSDILELR